MGARRPPGCSKFPLAGFHAETAEERRGAEKRPPFGTFPKGSVSAQVKALLPVKARFIKARFPIWTAVGVSDLYDLGAVTEIRLVVRKR